PVDTLADCRSRPSPGWGERAGARDDAGVPGFPVERMSTISTLLTSAGRRVALLRAFRRALATLGGGRVLAADAGSTAAAVHEADAHFVVPRCDSPDYVPALLDICRRESVVLVVPTIDPELPVLARAREAFAHVGIMVAVSAPATVDISCDKAKTAAFFV